MPVMAYSPVEQGRLVAHPALTEMAAEHDASPAQLTLAWLLARDDILPIPKAATVAHVRYNRAALDLTLSEADLRRLDNLFPPPCGSEPLAML
jgi:diketogulonate reductase-like aldo/keto reductase